MTIYRSLRSGLEGTKEQWLYGWDKVFDNTVVPQPKDLWERLVRVYQLVESEHEEHVTDNF